MTLSQLARSIPASPTLALNEEARILRERGEPVINMSIGEPKNKAPIAAVLSSAARLNTGRREVLRRSEVNAALDAHHRIDIRRG